MRKETIVRKVGGRRSKGFIPRAIVSRLPLAQKLQEDGLCLSHLLHPGVREDYPFLPWIPFLPIICGARLQAALQGHWGLLYSPFTLKGWDLCDP